MTLKQEFLDMMKLIAPNINDESYEEDYVLEQDFTMIICDVSGKDVTYDGCFYCEYRKDSIGCKHRSYKNVDIYLWSGSDDCRAFVFNRKLKEAMYSNSIRCINSRKQLLSEMSVLKKQFDYYRDGYAEYAQRLEEYKEYVTEFVEQITDEFSVFEEIDKDMIPVVFCSNYRRDHDWNKETWVSGDFNTNGLQTVIHIYSSWDNDMDDVKQRIRHEIIHYLLYCINPFGKWYKDDSGVFYYFCNLYNAGAYKEMDEANTRVYEELKKCSKEYVDGFLQECLKKTKEVYSN